MDDERADLKNADCAPWARWVVGRVEMKNLGVVDRVADVSECKLRDAHGLLEVKHDPVVHVPAFQMPGVPDLLDVVVEQVGGREVLVRPAIGNHGGDDALLIVARRDETCRFKGRNRDALLFFHLTPPTLPLLT